MPTKNFGETGQYLNPRYREFKVSIAATKVLHYAGIGVSLDDVLKQRKQVFEEEAGKVGAGGANAYVFVRDYGEEVVWEGTEVAAVLVPKCPEPTETYVPRRFLLLAYRFDNTTVFKAGRLWNWFFEKDDDKDEDDKDDKEEEDDDETGGTD